MLHAQRYEGRFFGRRVNCEQVPLLPAWVVARIFDDPKETSYLLVWKDSADRVQECVHLTPHHSDIPIPANELRIGGERDVETGEVEIQRDDGTTDIIPTLLRPLPRNGGSVRLLICPDCLTPRRGLYGWEPDEDGRFTTSVARSNWRCRACHKLRYASEGGALVLRGRGAVGRMFGRSRSDRPEPWLPDVFTTNQQGFCKALSSLDPSTSTRVMRMYR